MARTRKLTFPSIGTTENPFHGSLRTWRNRETGVEILRGPDRSDCPTYYVTVPHEGPSGRITIDVKHSFSDAFVVATKTAERWREKIAKAYVEAVDEAIERHCLDS